MQIEGTGKEGKSEEANKDEEERGQEIRKGIIYTRDTNRKAFKENGKRKKLVKKATKKMENGKQGGSKGRGPGGTKICFCGILLPTLS